MTRGGFWEQKVQRFLYPSAISFFSFFIIFNYFSRLRDLSATPIVLVVILVALTGEKLLSYLRVEKPSLRDNLEFGFLLILTFEIPLQATGEIGPLLYPLKYFILTMLALYFPILHALLIMLFALSLETAHQLIKFEFWSQAETLGSHVFFALVFVLVFGGAFKSERKWRNKAETRLADLNRDARSLGEAGAGHAADRGEHSTFKLEKISKEFREKREIAQVFDRDDRIYGVLDILKRTIHPFSVLIYFWEPDGNQLRLKDGSSDSDYLNFEKTFRSGEGVIGWVYQNHSPIQLHELANPLKGINYYSREEGIHSFLAVPIRRGAFPSSRRAPNSGDPEKTPRLSQAPAESAPEIIGVLAIDSRDISAFTDEQRKLLEVVAHQIVDTIENAEIRHQMSIEATEFAAFYEISKRLSAALRREEVLNLGLDSIREIVPYDFAAIATFDESTGRSVIQAARGEGAESTLQKSFGIEDGLVGWVLDSYRKIFCKGNLHERDQERPIFSKEIKIRGARSILTIPFSVEGRVIGSFTLLGKAANLFSEYEVKIFDVLANQIAISLEKSRLFHEKEAEAVTDPITGLSNHRRFQERIREEFVRSVRHPEPISLILIDLDFFKKVNDRYGHPAGDAVLRGLSRILKGAAREVDLVARYGGEEFTLLLPNTDSEGAMKLAERIRRLVESSSFPIEGGSKIGITISIGVASCPEDAQEPDELLQKADLALYTAKQKGRNRTIPFHRVAKEKEREKAEAPEAEKKEESDWKL